MVQQSNSSSMKGGELSASRLGHFTSTKSVPKSQWIETCVDQELSVHLTGSRNMFLIGNRNPNRRLSSPQLGHCIYWATHLKFGYATINHTKSGYVWEWQTQSITSQFKQTRFFRVTHNNFVKTRCVVSFVINAILCVKTTMITYNFFNSFSMHHILNDNAIKNPTTQIYQYVILPPVKHARQIQTICITE